MNKGMMMKKKSECFVSSTLAVANGRAALRVGRSFVALDTKHYGTNILEGTDK